MNAPIEIEIVSWIVSTAIFAVVTIFQVSFFCGNIGKLRRLRTLFPKSASQYAVQADGEEPEIVCPPAMQSGELGLLVDELNTYIRKNHGTTDFSVIQNKTERRLSLLYNDATSRTAFPTYLGLMGTFLGVFIGLLFFSYGLNSSADGVTDQAIGNLIKGVLVSMLTSFFGLLLTTVTHWYASVSQCVLSRDKNQFYEFLQNELMPTLGVSMVAALHKLHQTINTFTPAFNQVIDRFQQTFDTCTQQFGSAFEQNVKSVSTAVDVMGKNMDKINENISLQKRLLETLGSSRVLRSIDAFVAASERFGQVAEALGKIDAVIADIEHSTTVLIQTQQDYNASLSVPRELVDNLNKLLDRVTTFEDSINALGARLDKEQLLGNNMLTLIGEHLDALAGKRSQIERYVDITDEQLARVFEAQTRSIERINRQFEQNLADCAAEYRDILDQMKAEIQERRREVLAELEDKFNITRISEEFVQLRRLEAIEGQLQEMQKQGITDGTSLMLLLKNSDALSESIAGIDEIRKTLAAIDERCLAIAGIRNSITDRNGADAQSMQQLMQQTAAIKDSLMQIMTTINNVVKSESRGSLIGKIFGKK